MNLDFFKEIENSLKNAEVKETINNFLNELSGYLQNYKEKPNNSESMEKLKK